MDYHVFAPFFQLLVHLPANQLKFFLLKFLTPSTANEYTVTDLFHFAEKFVSRIPTYTQLIQTLILYLQIFPKTEPSKLMQTTCTMATRIPLIFQNMIFVICLTELPKIHSLHLATNIVDKQMVQLWNFHWVQPQLTVLCVVLRVNGFEIVLMISNLYSIDVLLIAYQYFFFLLIMYLSSKHPNINLSLEMLTFFVKTRNFQLASIEKRFILTSKVLCLKNIRLV